jgi:hypothetical protein
MSGTIPDSLAAGSTVLWLFHDSGCYGAFRWSYPDGVWRGEFGTPLVPGESVRPGWVCCPGDRSTTLPTNDSLRRLVDPFEAPDFVQSRYIELIGHSWR